ncbi:hypothetical protein GXW78_16940 [Roseomonas terrae]|uniref:Uncharacterized protein n=1 Tax=Neoroseomonas terrae TaxID=424799 RepID=A0ABS5EK11_9PROT|nr:hypothetical protein [Neoroseomonas terrae]MBR0651362.1 hypothetical protein [Neoroseomonas terrae]
MKVALFNAAMRLLAAGVVFYALTEVVQPFLARHDVTIVIRPWPPMVPQAPLERRT